MRPATMAAHRIIITSSAIFIGAVFLATSITAGIAGPITTAGRIGIGDETKKALETSSGKPEIGNIK
jgi:hypothetical protein